MKKLTKVIIVAMHDWQDKKTSTYGKLTTLCDALIAGGYGNPELYRAPKGKEADRTFYDQVISVLVKGLPLEAQQLLAPMSPKEAKLAFTPVQMEERRKWSQRKGADMADIRNALTNRAEKRAGQTSATWEAKLVGELEKRVKELRKLETGSTFYSITKVINLSNDLIKELKK